MSEYLKNKEYKKETLKRLIGDLHKGRSFEEVKRKFQQLVDGVDSVEIADLEQELIAECLSPEEIKRLCDVHAALFREALARNEQVEIPEGHPLLALKTENDEARKALAEIEAMLDRLPEDATGQGNPLERLRERIARFGKELDSHYRKKENLSFPYLEKHNVTGPPAVMWAVDDEIRRMLKDFSALLEKATADQEDPGKIRESFVALRDKITEMFSKEEDILIPMLKNTLSEAEWAEIREQMEGKETAAPYRSGSGNGIALDTGMLTPAEINAVLTNLPVDVTFVDRNDEVRYFSQTKERIFPRSRAIIGRKVQNCHPPASVHVVDKIINDFKHGRQNRAEFWLQLNGRFIYIQYLALRDDNGNYLGTLEVTRDITRVRSLEGEQRLLKYMAEPVGVPQ